jgi:serpin B
MPRHLRPFLLASSVLTLSCTKSPSEPQGLPAAVTALPRALTQAESGLRDAANAFSFALWNRVNGTQADSNVFLSPLSATFALGMTLNGAAGATYDEMRAALQLGGLSEAEVNTGYKSLLALLTSLDATVDMRVANSIWYRQTFAFHQSFLDAGRTYFDAEIAGLDFTNAAAALATINGWVSEHTNGRIPSIIDEIRDEHVMFLINAIYFNGSWRERFDPAETRDDTFRSSDGATQPARLMHRRDTIAYAESPAWQAVDLPYGNTAFTMTVVLPREGTDIETLAGSFDATTWNTLTAALEQQQVDLLLPKVKLSYERTLNDDLTALGMQRAFIGNVADFTRMSPAGDQLYIDFVKQKTFVDIHEEGTEAAAATAVGVGVTSAPLVYDVRVDRPYLIVLRERLSGTVVFMGKIARMPED